MDMDLDIYWRIDNIYWRYEQKGVTVTEAEGR